MAINSDIAAIFREIAMLLEMKGVQFKPRAFEKAASTIESMSDDLKDIYKKGGIKAILEIPGVGQSMAQKIEEYIKTGKVKDHLALKKQVPVNLEDLSSIEGIGPKMILKLYKRLHIKDREQLEKAVRGGKLRHLKGFGEKTEQNLLKNIEFLKTSGGRVSLGFILPPARNMLERLKSVPDVESAEMAGSIRRMQETIGDVDFVVSSRHPLKIIDFFVTMPEVIAIHAKGDTKASVRLSAGVDADLRVVEPESFGAAVQYFIGDKYHNVAVRQIAIGYGYKLNEYGLYKGRKVIAGKDERDIYEALGMQYPEPELRTNRGEIQAALDFKLPKIIGYNDVKGDLQMHTDWTDGKYTIQEMAEAAKKLGHEYICISDHTKSLAMTNGMDEKRLAKQMTEIDRVQKKVSGIKIFKGAEVNILKDGSLDMTDESLSKLDICGAAIHSHFNLSEKEQTARIIQAMENPHIDIIYHPTGRVINRREGYKVDMEAIIKAAKRTGTILEIDSYPDRLDLRDEHIRICVDAGVKLSIDTDSHSTAHLKYIEYGIAQARRGWATKKDIINTYSWQEMLKLIK